LGALTGTPKDLQSREQVRLRVNIIREELSTTLYDDDRP